VSEKKWYIKKDLNADLIRQELLLDLNPKRKFSCFACKKEFYTRSYIDERIFYHFGNEKVERDICFCSKKCQDKMARRISESSTLK